MVGCWFLSNAHLVLVALTNQRRPYMIHGIAPILWYGPLVSNSTVPKMVGTTCTPQDYLNILFSNGPLPMAQSYSTQTPLCISYRLLKPIKNIILSIPAQLRTAPSNMVALPLVRSNSRLSRETVIEKFKVPVNYCIYMCYMHEKKSI